MTRPEQPIPSPLDNPPESHYVPANGLRHHYYVWGEAANPPLLMLHGIGLCGLVWGSVARVLAEDYYVMSFDLRGHGGSDKPGSYTFHELGQDLVALVPALGLEQPRLVGHSAGGSAALIASSLAPGPLGPTVIVDSGVGGSRALTRPPDRRDRVTRTLRKRPVWESREAMAAAYQGRSVFRSWTDRAFQDYIQGGTRLLSDGRAELMCPPTVEAALYAERATFSTSPYLVGLEGKFLLLLGNYPEAQKPGDAGIQEFLREVKGSQVRVLEQGSHFAPMEYPDLVLREIRDFFTMMS
ncbi:MAG: alpha/beta fold hydrolase [Dehalococcoidia bacterium]